MAWPFPRPPVQITLSLATAAVLAGAAPPAPVAAQSPDNAGFSVDRLGLIGGRHAAGTPGATLSGGAIVKTGSIAFTLLGEAFFHHGRPDERFQETEVSVVYPNAPLVEVRETICQDPNTEEVFARGECQVGKARPAAMLDVVLRRPLANHELGVGLGYRLSADPEPYMVMVLSGARADSPGHWVARLLVSRSAFGVQLGYGVG